MKKNNRLIKIGLCSTILLTLVACSQVQKSSDGTTDTSVTQIQSNQFS